MLCLGAMLPLTVFAQNIEPVTSLRSKDIYCDRLDNPKTYEDEDFKNFNQLIAGDDNWLFRTQFDLKDRFFLTDKTKRYLKRFDNALQHYDTELIIAMVPTRGITSHEKLPKLWRENYDLEKAVTNYNRFLDEIRSTGIKVTKIHDVASYDNFFYPRDNHWTSEGAELIARAVAKELMDLDIYNSIPKKSYEIVTAKPVDNTLWPNQYENIADQICGRSETETDISEYLKVQEISNGGNIDEESLFGDDDLPQVVVLGTSNSTEIIPSYANFTGFIKRFANIDLINEAISGGSLKGSITKYFLDGKLEKQNPKAIIWEVSAYYGYNQQDFYRGLIPSVYGDCSAKDTIQSTELLVAPEREEFIVFDNLRDFNLVDHTTYVALEFEDKQIRNVYVNFIHDKGLRDVVHLTRKKRSFPQTNGKFYAEASNILETPVNKIIVSAKNGTGTVKAKLCRAPIEADIEESENIQITEEASLVEEDTEEFSFKILPLDKDISAPKVNIPPLDEYTLENLLKRIPQLEDGIITIERMKGAPPLRNFVFDKRLAEMRNVQDTVEPQAIHVRSGVYNFESLREKLKDMNALIDTEEGYLLTLPLAVYPNAAVVFQDLDKPLLLSQEQGSFIATAGDLFFINSELTAWSENTQSPALLKDELDNFRPFIVTWNGSEIYIADSVINNLGYNAPKSYGITLSSNKVIQEKYGAGKKLPRPTGWLINNKFNDMYFGFYSYEADDVIIYKNKYIDNIVYGIDPHDRSERLIIADNYVAGSKQKHGIIVSREVNNSFIVNNVTEYNQGSGVMLDRMSSHNLVANNISRFNQGDGITLYESPHNILANNQITDNQGTGIRVRNSWDIDVVGGQILLNKAQAFTIYQDNLLGTGRDFDVDPVTLRSLVNLQSVDVESNKGLLKTEGFAKISIQDMNWTNGSMTSRNYYGDLEKFENDLNETMHKKKDFILVSDKINSVPEDINQENNIIDP